MFNSNKTTTERYSIPWARLRTPTQQLEPISKVLIANGAVEGPTRSKTQWGHGANLTELAPAIPMQPTPRSVDLMDCREEEEEDVNETIKQ